MLSHIRRVDIEIQSKCNRKCEWCPNKTLLRDNNYEMPEELFIKILYELKNNNFAYNFFPDSFKYNKDEIFIEEVGRLLLSGYGEPFINPDLLKKRVKQAYEILNPKTKIVVNTNGDFLTKDSLDGLLLSNLGIMDYDNKGIEYWINKLKEMNVLIIDIDYNNEIIYGIHEHTDSITVFCNWKNHISLDNRGGYFKEGDLPEYNWKSKMSKRTIPCPELDYFFSIAYDGSVMPCSCMRFDNPDHQKYIIGNVKNNTLVEIYSSKNAQCFRNMIRNENGDFPEPCKNCQKIIYEDCFNAPTKYVYNGFKYLNKYFDQILPLNT